MIIIWTELSRFLFRKNVTGTDFVRILNGRGEGSCTKRILKTVRSSDLTAKGGRTKVVLPYRGQKSELASQVFVFGTASQKIRGLLTILRDGQRENFLNTTIRRRS